MLKQEDVAFLKAISAARQCPALLRELRKALAASKEKAVAVRKPAGPAKALTRREEIKRKASQRLAFLWRTCLASTYSGARLREQLVRFYFYGGRGCLEQPGAAETSVCRGGGRARCSVAKWAA
jgi:hypothetical protein